MFQPIFADSLSRLGTESAFEILARANKLAAQGHDIINLGIGQPDFHTPEHIVEAGIKALQDGHHGYTPDLFLEKAGVATVSGTAFGAWGEGSGFYPASKLFCFSRTA